MQPNNSTSYSQTPDEAFWNTPAASKAEIEIVSTPAPLDNFPTKRGRPFQKGFDARRHKFTRAECSAGFWAAIESIVTRHPHAIMRDGRHIAVNFLRSRAVAQVF